MRNLWWINTTFLKLFFFPLEFDNVVFFPLLFFSFLLFIFVFLFYSLAVVFSSLLLLPSFCYDLGPSRKQEPSKGCSQELTKEFCQSEICSFLSCNRCWPYLYERWNICFEMIICNYFMVVDIFSSGITKKRPIIVYFITYKKKEGHLIMIW